jgi:hypothetical protein
VDAIVSKETACRAAELEALLQAKHKELEGVLAEVRVKKPRQRMVAMTINPW